MSHIRMLFVYCSLFSILALAACTSATPTAPMPAPTNTLPPLPTDTIAPSKTPEPSPTDTPIPSPTPTLPPTDTPLPTDTPTPSISPTPYTCSDKIGCLQISPGEPLRLGYILSLTGGASSIGADTLNGLQFAVEEKAKLFGHSIVLTGEDEQCKPEEGRAAAQRLLAGPPLVAVFGTTCSNAARTAVPLLSKAGLSIVSSSNTAYDLTAPINVKLYKGYLRVIPGDHWQGDAIARFAIQHLLVTNAATIYAADETMQVLNKSFVEEFKGLGGKVVTQVSIRPDQTNISQQLNKVASSGAELVFLAVSMPQGGILIEQARATPGLENVYLVGTEMLWSPDLEREAGPAVDGFYISKVDLNPPNDIYSNQILPAYQARFGAEPSSFFAAFSIDAARLLFAAIERVGIVYPDSTLYIPRQALRDALYTTQNFEGLTGLLTCTPNGDCADLRNILLYQYKVGMFPPERVWP